jgi:hypothetical protein
MAKRLAVVQLLRNRSTRRALFAIRSVCLRSIPAEIDHSDAVLLGLPDLILAEKFVLDRQLLIDAEQQAKVFHPDAGPFQLDVDFVVYVQVPSTGHLTLRWKQPIPGGVGSLWAISNKPIVGTVAGFIPVGT